MTKILEELVQEQLGYCPATGDLFWKVGRPGVRAGSLAGRNAYPYKRVMVQRKNLLAHRVAFLLMTGRWPSEIDHINRDPSDNRWVNLREVTRSENQRNKNQFVCKAYGKSGVKGVYKTKSGKYQVLGRGTVYLGVYPTLEEAEKVSKEHWENVVL